MPGSDPLQLAQAQASGPAAVSIQHQCSAHPPRDPLGDPHQDDARWQQVAQGMSQMVAVLNSRQSLGEILDAIVRLTCPLLDSDAAALFQHDPDGLLRIQAACGLDRCQITGLSLHWNTGGAGRALAQHCPVPLPDVVGYCTLLAQEPASSDQELAPLRLLIDIGVRSLLAVPLIVQGEDYGALTLYYTRPRFFGEEDLRLALVVAHQIALAIESARLREQAAQAATLAERNRLARELHDSVTQSLYSVTLYAEAAVRMLAAGETAIAAEHLRELRDTAQETLRDMRLLIFELRPPALEKTGLAEALLLRLESVEARGGVQAKLEVEGTEQLPLPVRVELYQIAQESLNNLLKHAHASHVGVSLCFANDSAHLEVCDDGLGFDPELVGSGGFGLSGMRERAERIGAHFQVASAPGQGTRVIVDYPGT